MSRTDEKNSVSRRNALKTIGVAGGAVAVAGAGVAGTTRAPARVRSTAKREPNAQVREHSVASADVVDETTRALFAPLQAAGRVGDCTIVAVHAVKMGAIPVVLATAEGVRFQVDVLRHDANARGVNGVRAAGSLTAALHNEGGGDNSTREAEGLGAMALLEALAAREADGAALPALLTLAQRSQRFPRGVLSVLA